ncbi:MAG: 50S ribosomal protein L20 [Deltaproteobacteria bacterium]|jgi:large subunit ribosomal protein L20|nr:50S ribosomal protein L20 [Deltaproteobacteria bacterium]
MPRVKGGPKARRRHQRILKGASGFVGGRKLLRQGRNTLEKGLVYAYRDRKRKKRAFRALWVVRINAAARRRGLSYSRFMRGLAQAGVGLDRKQLALLAAGADALFDELVRLARAGLEARPDAQAAEAAPA